TPAGLNEPDGTCTRIASRLWPFPPGRDYGAVAPSPALLRHGPADGRWGVSLSPRSGRGTIGSNAEIGPLPRAAGGITSARLRRTGRAGLPASGATSRHRGGW